MNEKLNDVLVGDKFVRWTVISEKFKSNRHWSVLCKCECGAEKIVRVEKLRTNKTRSCGCLRDEELTKHGQTKRATRTQSSEYWIWNAMIQRCRNKNNKQYPEYGGRGITVDENWLNFEGFIADMGFRPSKLHSIDRINNNLGYTKSNCEWRLRLQQNRNKRNNVFLTANGETLCLAEWGDRLGCTALTITGRLKRGWSVVDAVTVPARKINRKRNAEPIAANG